VAATIIVTAWAIGELSWHVLNQAIGKYNPWVTLLLLFLSYLPCFAVGVIMALVEIRARAVIFILLL